MSLSHLWQPPSLQQGAEGKRKVGWLELFFDLVLVVLVATEAHSLEDNVDLDGIVSYLILGVPVFMVWLGHTIYNQRFETNDVSYRLFTFIQMFFIGVMALFMGDAMTTDGPAFALSYAAARTFLVLLWLRAGRYAPLARPLTNFYAVGFGLSIIIFVWSAFLPADTRVMVWVVALLIDIATPLASLRLQHNLPRLDRHKLAERYGLLTIIILGESLLVTIENAADRRNITVQGILMMGASIWILFMIWWLYFDSIARRVPRASVWGMGVYTYAHFGLMISAMALPAGGFSAVNAGEGLDPAVRLLGGISLAGTLIFIALLELLLDPHGNYARRQRVLAKVLGALLIFACDIILYAPGAVLAAQGLILTLMAVLNWHPSHFSDSSHG